MLKQSYLRLFAGLIVLVLLSTWIHPVLAHGATSVGDYDLEIGFHNEPVLQGEPNSLDLFVTNSQTGESVNGLDQSLRAEIIYGSAQRELELMPQEDLDGAYTAYVLPTEVGDYTWHIWGDIEGTPVDVSMTSGPDTFGSVEAKSTIAFPGSESSSSELQAQAASTQRTAQAAGIVGIAGLVTGVGGLALGFIGVRSGRRTLR